MKNSKLFAVIFMVAFVALFVAMPTLQAEEEMTCPVSGKTIKKSEAKASFVHQGKTYNFCCDGCKEKFEKNPEQYTKQSEEEKSMKSNGNNGNSTPFCCSGNKEATCSTESKEESCSTTETKTKTIKK